MMIRRANPEDAERIERLMRSVPGFWDDSWRPDVVLLSIRNAAGLAFVWEEDDRLLGFICCHDLGFRAYLSELVVSEDAQGKGLGRQLLEQVTQELQRRGCAIVIADVWRDAEGFYRRLGWSAPDVTLLRKHLEVQRASSQVLPRRKRK